MRQAGGRDRSDLADRRAPARWTALLTLLVLLVVPQLHASVQHGLRLDAVASTAATAFPSSAPSAQAAVETWLSDSDAVCEVCNTLQGAKLSPVHALSAVLPRVPFAPATGDHVHALQRAPLDLFCRPPPRACKQEYAGAVRSQDLVLL